MRLAALGTFLVLTANAQRISTSSRCRPNFGLTCQRSTFGNCCSQYGFCGSTSSYCGTGCQKGWGTCNSGSLSSTARPTTTPSPSPLITRSSSTQTGSSAAVSPTQKVSKNARCGYLFNASPGGQTCLGSVYGDCCSDQSYCGSTNAYCGAGCQPAFGNCNPVSLAISGSPSTFATSIRSSTLSAVSSSSTGASSTPGATSPSSVASSSSVAFASSSAISSSASIASPSSSAASSTVSPLSSVQAQSSSYSSASSSSSSLTSDVSSSAASSSAASSSPASSPADSPTPSSDIISTNASPTSRTIETPSDTPTPTPIPTCGVNIFTNPGFETGQQAPWQINVGFPWTFTVKTSDGHASPNYLSAAGQLEQNQAFHMTQSVTFAQNSVAEASAYFRITGSSQGQTYVALSVDNTWFGTGNPNKYVPVGAGWVQVTFGQKTITAGTHTIDLYVQRNSGPRDMEISLDDFSLVPICAV